MLSAGKSRSKIATKPTKRVLLISLDRGEFMKLDNSLRGPSQNPAPTRAPFAAFALAASLLVSALVPVMPAQAATSAAPANAPASYTCLYYTVKAGRPIAAHRHSLRHHHRNIDARKRHAHQPRLHRPAAVHSARHATQATAWPRPSQPGSGPWYGEYWNNTAQSGAPSLVRNDAALNFNWGFGTPDAAQRLRR